MARFQQANTCKVYQKWPIVGENETHIYLLIAFTGNYQLLHTVLKKEPKLKEALNTIDAWSTKWFFEKPNEYRIPKPYFKGSGNYLCLMLPKDSMFFIKLKLLERISEDRLNIL